jgi:hypothetical protein
LGTFGTEEEAARAVDRMTRWCEIHGKMRQEGEAVKYNFNNDENAGEKVALKAVTTQGEMITKLREVAARVGGAASWGMSKFKGVSLVQKSGRWKSEITIDNKKTLLGTFDKEDEAAHAYDRMSIWCKIHGKMKHGGYKLNFDSSNYTGEEAALMAVDTMEAMVTKIREVAVRAGGATTCGLSTFRGVCLEKKTGRWKSLIMIDNKNTYLSTFNKEEEAARAYDRMSIWCKIHGKTKHRGYKLNFDSSNYADEEEELRVCTQADLIKRLKFGKAVSVEEEESVGSDEIKRGQKRKQPPHSEDDDHNAADDGDEEADDDSGDAYVADEEKEKEEDKEEVKKEDDDVENEDGSDTSGGSDTGGGGHILAAELSAVGHIHAATVIVAKGTTTIGAEIVTIADQEDFRLRANNNVELGDALYSAQAQAAAAAAAAIAVKDHNGVSIITIDGGGDDGVGCGGYMDWTSAAGICSGDRHDAGGGGGGMAAVLSVAGAAIKS